MRIAALPAFAATALISFHSTPLASAQGSSPTLISASIASVSASGGSWAPVVSLDERLVVFTSQADDLVTNDFNRGLMDIFVRDVTQGSITLASVNTNGVSANGPSYSPAISTNGQIAAFVSEASDLATNAVNGLPQVFVRDLHAGITRLASRALDGTGANASSVHPVLSTDGRFAFFESGASNLVAAAVPKGINIYRTDIESGEVALVSVPDPSWNGVPAGTSQGVDVSDDGTQVIFVSSNPLTAPVNGSWSNLYLHDMLNGQTTMINLPGTLPPRSSSQPLPPVLSADGSVAAFWSLITATNGLTGGVYRVQLPNGTPELLAPGLDTLFRYRQGMLGPLLSRDGNLVFFEAVSPALTNEIPEAVYVWDAAARQLSLISTNTVLLSNNPQPQPFGHLTGISGDGRFVSWLGFPNAETPYPSNQPLELFVQDRTTGETRVISRTPSGSPSTNSTDFPAVSFSAGGYEVAFQSSASDLATGDLNQSSDVFLYAWRTDTLDLVSRRATPLASSTGIGLSLAGPDCISADGQRLVFISSAHLSGAIDPGGIPNVYLRDLITGSNQLVSANSQGTGPANGACYQAVLSADGRWVAFMSIASNLTTNDTNQVQDVFLRDLATGQTTLVSHNPQGQAGNAASSSPTISPDGSYVAFTSFASDLTAGVTNIAQNVYAFARAGGFVRLVNSLPNSFSANPSYHALFSPDGKWLVFERPDLFGTQVILWQVGTSTPILLAHGSSYGRFATRPISFSGDSSSIAFDVVQNSTNLSVLVYQLGGTLTSNLITQATTPSLSGDGSRMAFLAAGNGNQRQVELWDRTQGTTNLVSLSYGTAAASNGRCFAPLITPNGRFVIFASQATDLLPGDTNGITDIFVRDLQAGTTLLLSPSLAGGFGDAMSSAPILGRDGRTVLFASAASNLVPGDYNQQPDLFLVRLPGAESGFQVLSITRPFGGATTLVWAAQAGASYAVEFTDALGSAWQALNTTIQNNGSQATAMDSSAAGSARFYRIVQLAP